MSQLPDGLVPQELSGKERNAVQLVQGSYMQLGNLLAAGFVKEKDVFAFPNITRVGIESWEKTKHIPRANEERGMLPRVIYHEYLAARAEAYLDRNGLKVFGGVPRFDSNPAVMKRVAAEVSRARSAA